MAKSLSPWMLPEDIDPDALELIEQTNKIRQDLKKQLYDLSVVFVEKTDTDFLLDCISNVWWEYSGDTKDPIIKAIRESVEKLPTKPG